MNKTLPSVLALSVFAVPAFAQPQSNIDPVPGIKAVVNDFVKALNGDNVFTDATPDVAKGKRYVADGGQEWGKSWIDKRGNLFLTVEKIEVSDLIGDSGKAHVSYHWTNDDPRMQSESIKEDLNLRMDSQWPGHWQITPEIRPVGLLAVQLKNVPVLNDVGFRVAHPNTAWEVEKERCAHYNLTVIGDAVVQFSTKNDGKLSFTSGSYPDVLKPFLHAMNSSMQDSESALKSPASGTRFTFNSQLEGYQLPTENLEQNLSQTVMFYEGKDEKLAYLYQGKTQVLFLDGHVGYVTPEKAKNLVWKP